MRQAIIMCVLLLLAMAVALYFVFTSSMFGAGAGPGSGSTDPRQVIIEGGDVYDALSKSAYSPYLSDVIHQDRPVFSKEDVELSVAELQPMVEEIAGRTFTGRLHVRAVERSDVILTVLQDTEWNLALAIPLDVDRTDDGAITRAADMVGTTSLARYSFANDAMVLSVHNTLPILARLKMNEAQAADVLTLVLAYELTHALQDQTLELHALKDGLADPDGGDAYRRLLAGHAAHVQAEVARRLGLDDAPLQAARRACAAVIPLDEEALEDLTETMSAYLDAVHPRKMDRIAEVRERDGTVGVWALLESSAIELRGEDEAAAAVESE